MLAVALPEAELAPPPEGLERSTGGCRGQRSGVPIVSGEPDALAELLRGLRSATRSGPQACPPSTTPPTPPQVEALEDELLEAFAPVTPRAGEIPFYSTVTGGALDTARARRRVLVPQPARDGALRSGDPRPARRRAERCFLEIGPHPVLGFRGRGDDRGRPGRAPSDAAACRHPAPRRGRPAALRSGRRWPRPTWPASSSTGRRSSPARGQAGARCPPTRSSASATG